MKHNFCSGPSILPQEVYRQAADAVLDFEGSGLSLLEISHRSDAFVAVMDEALALVRALLGVPDDYDVLFLQGGASMQFAMVPLNLLPDGGRAGLINTGVWTQKAIEDLKKLGEAVVVASSEDRNFAYIPKDYIIPGGLDYLHIVTNNTICGTEWHDVPTCDCPLVADMSSNIFSKAIDVSRFDLIFAGAQKNLGPAGATLVIVKKALYGRSGRALPNMLDYRVHAKAGSMSNTPPVFAVYVCLLMLRWIKAQGGIPAMEANNRDKADMLYRELDRNSLVYGTADGADRSRMNVTFRLHDESLEQRLYDFFDARDIVNINGHRLVGGFRASLYNALPLSSVYHLVEVLQEFERVTSNK